MPSITSLQILIVLFQVRFGYLQVDNCILEDGMVYVQSPGSCHVKYCTFRHATVIFQHLSASIIENCEFSQTDTAAVTIEGHPKDERNWTYNSLLDKIAQNCNIKNFNKQKMEMAPTSAYSTSTALTSGQKMLEKSYTFSTDQGDHTNDQRRKSFCSSGKFSSMVTTEDHGNCGHSSNGSMHFESVINSDILDHLPIPTAVLCDLPSINVTTPALLPKSDLSSYEFHPDGENVQNGQSTYRSGLEHFGPALSCSNEKKSSSQMTSEMGDNSSYDHSVPKIDNATSSKQEPSSSHSEVLSSNPINRKSPNTEQRCATYVNENNDQNSQNNQSVSRQSSGSRTRSERSNRSVSPMSGSSDSLFDREESEEFDSGSVNSANSNQHAGKYLYI